MPSYRDQALCRDMDPELWFPISTREAANSTADAVCVRCPVKSECLEDALAKGHRHGTWGGVNQWDREVLHRVYARGKADA